MNLDYKKLGLRVGIEIHQQLQTKHKLFCSCLARLSPDEPVREFTRKLRPVAGELGKVDIAALHEKLQARTFHYKIYKRESCAVETDSEPPHPINPEALEIALKICLMLKCEIPDEVQVMRKTILDGSNVSGFQRTALVGLNGWVDTSFGRVGITNVSVEEDSCQRLGGSKTDIVYGLDRLGIPLVEIGTTPDVRHPQQARELAEKIGMILRSTGKVKTGLGKIRQDINVSIKGGTRTEIKGVQSLSLIPKAINEETKRQLALVRKGKKPPAEVRKCLPSGKSEFMRPLAGAARMYPETDIPPIKIEQAYLDELKLQLPELLVDRMERYVTGYRISPEIARQLIRSPWFSTFELLAEWADPGLVATTLTATIKQLKREGVPVDRLEQSHLRDVFEALKEGRITKEAIPDVLKAFAKNPSWSMANIIKKLGLETLSTTELEKLIKKTVKENPQVLKTSRPEKALMGLVMKKVRGRAPGRIVMQLILEELGS